MPDIQESREYTPTTDAVRSAASRYMGAATFNRWLAAHEAGVEAEALHQFRKRLIEDQLHSFGIVLPDVSKVVDDLATEADGLIARAHPPHDLSTGGAS